jgi:o-succinylbenzoate synthase
VTDFDVEAATYRFRTPIATAYGTLHEREVLVLQLRDERGIQGLGEAAPLPGYGPGTLADARADLVEMFSGSTPPGEFAFRTPQAASALDVATRDLDARRAARPFLDGLCEQPSTSIRVNATIAATDRAGASREAAAAVESGFACVKLKVGVGDDAGRVAAVRAAVGPDAAIRVDANGAWSPDEAVAALRSLAPAGIEMCEEPVHGVAALAEVRERLDGEVPIAMDESASQPDALESGACDFVCLKTASAGGITPLVEAARRARATGSGVYVASTYDGPIGIAAGLHAAAALGPDIPACGLATLPLFEGVDDPFPVRDGRIEVPRGPGLGVTWPAG